MGRETIDLHTDIMLRGDDHPRHPTHDSANDLTTLRMNLDVTEALRKDKRLDEKRIH